MIPLKTECVGTLLHERFCWRQPKPTSRSCSRTSQRRSTPATRAAPPRDYTRTVYRRCPGSVLAQQRKKVDLARNPAGRRRPEQEVFLQPADTAQNVGAKPGGREEEEGMNEPRAPWGFI
jgi:hypothetical protein